MYTAGWVMFMVFADAEVQSWSELEKDAIVDTRFHTERVVSLNINDNVLGRKYSCTGIISTLLYTEEMVIALRKHRNSEIGRYFLGISRDARNIPDKEALAELAIEATDVADQAGFSGRAVDVVDTMLHFGGATDVVDTFLNTEGVADVVDKVRNSGGVADVVDKVRNSSGLQVL